MHILLVDDDSTFSDVIAARLEQRDNISLTLAVSAEHALQLVDAASEPFDCFLLDIMMGNIDGIELCHRLRQHSSYHTTPIIMMTASQETPLMEQAFHAGATDFLRKPLDEVELAGRIKSAMLLVDALKREKAGRTALHSVLTSHGPIDGFDISERICLSGVSGMLDYHELEKSLLRLQDGLYHLSVFRIALPTFQRASNSHARSETLQLLRDVSQGILTAAPADTPFMSYIGRGRFLCCVLGRMTGTSETFRTCIQDKVCSMLNARNLDYSDAFEVAVHQLNDHRIISRTAAVALVRSEFERASLSLESLPPVHDIEENIFAETDWLLWDADAGL